MTGTKFNPGDRVRLRANGLVGVVREVGEPGSWSEVRVAWDTLRGTYGYRKRYLELINTPNPKGE
ncbi:hypothetical protein ACT17_15160 [Mycolicibacterium conceptionense]|uniref:Uncharacterized protein n=1 Tax=Mycolicibacterium conceptionense TaxID=451644 RepID=A0A0J8WX62_9MYCO|nr:hypothetical protein [Mycolicibacterium conceptionense]KMV17619.1 hypothetical protein ACT17_15160 [Mycolicibacterium conceptionense]